MYIYIQEYVESKVSRKIRGGRGHLGKVHLESHRFQHVMAV